MLQKVLTVSNNNDVSKAVTSHILLIENDNLLSKLVVCQERIEG